MVASPQTREDMALFYGTKALWASVHEGAGPGTTGANEVTAAGYERKQVTWTGGTPDGVITAAELPYSLPAGNYTGIGLWTAKTGGQFVDGAMLSPAAQLAAAGDLLITPRFTQS